MSRTTPSSGISALGIDLIPRDGYLEARHFGTYAHPAYKIFIARAIRSCLEHGLALLFVDISSLSKFAPTTTQRYEMGELGARLGSKLERVAILGTASQIETQFATLVARNRGLNIRAFSDREEALRWLIGDGPPGQP